MDAGRFDRLTRAFTRGRSRRELARFLGGLTGASIFGTVLGREDVLAHNALKACRKHEDRE
jgi:hypothetical protein